MNDSSESLGKRIGVSLRDKSVTIIVIIFIAVGLYASEGLSVSFFINELLARFFRNGFLVLALIIPVVAGLGLNFGIVAGALSGMLATMFVRYQGALECPDCAVLMAVDWNDKCAVFPECAAWSGWGGLSGLIICFLLALPLAALIGYLSGKLYNKTRGQEMIASLIVGFFANAVYWLIALIIVGTLIPVDPNHVMIIPGGVGIVSTFDMGMHPLQRIFDPEVHTVGLSYSLDWIWRVAFGPALAFLSAGILAYIVTNNIRARKNPAINKQGKIMFIINCVLCLAFMLAGLHTWLLPGGIIFHFGGGGSFTIPASPLTGVREIPAVTIFVIIAVGLFSNYFLKTKLGQDCRSVGQSQHIAGVSGINVDRTRIIATIISTVLASWGMIIWMQNVGTVNTYGAHTNIGFFAVASLLVGGGSMSKATVKNAMIGTILFHAMFIVSPHIGSLIAPENANVGEYTRTFMVYGIIAVSLSMHIWKSRKTEKEKGSLAALEREDAVQRFKDSFNLQEPGEENKG